MPTFPWRAASGCDPRHGDSREACTNTPAIQTACRAGSVTWRRSPARTALAVVLSLAAGCGTLVQVVDETGVPIAGAEVRSVWPSFDGPPTTTDADGYTRLDDASLLLPGPQWLSIDTPDGSWTVGYPPPAVIRLTANERHPPRRTRR